MAHSKASWDITIVTMLIDGVGTKESTIPPQHFLVQRPVMYQRKCVEKMYLLTRKPFYHQANCQHLSVDIEL